MKDEKEVQALHYTGKNQKKRISNIEHRMLNIEVDEREKGAMEKDS